MGDEKSCLWGVGVKAVVAFEGDVMERCQCEMTCDLTKSWTVVNEGQPNLL